MEWLRRNAAPLSEKVWKEIDETAASMFKQTVVVRRIADFDGPRGWNHVATQLGTFKPVKISQSSPKVRFSIPDVMLLTEIRSDFTIAWADIDIFERVGPTLESKAIEEASRQTALGEDSLILFGSSVSPGLLRDKESPRVALSDWSVPGRVVTDLLAAVEKLDSLGVKGPYEAVLSTQHYYSYLRQTGEGGAYPAAKQLGIVLAKVYSSPLIEGGALFSTRGGDYVVTVGGDFTVGYRWHDDTSVHLFCVETVAAQLLTPEAVCLIHPD
ncbi:MAG TPA: family 1 encapsulin nanocompartment shell protein [Terriglobia bacterium]|nr:family 1 encapsulin nanocompartment shell protein [Terriglobia bacterium]